MEASKEIFEDYPSGTLSLGFLCGINFDFEPDFFVEGLYRKFFDFFKYFIR
jgi:hypothetical protein